LDDYHREQIISILNYEGQILPPFMEDMDEYHRCLDEIGKCNHIMALDELSDNESCQAELRQEEVKNNELKIEMTESQERPPEQIDTTAGDNMTAGSVMVTNFLKDSEDVQ